MRGFVTPESLERGVDTSRSRRAWERDLHDRFYSELNEALGGGLNAESRRNLVDQPSRWQAIRPLYKQVILDRGLEHLDTLNAR